MQIIFGEPPKELVEKYITLELDTIQYAENAEPITAYCVIGGENVTLEEVSTLKEYANMHKALMRNYRNQNWNFCEEAINSLRGKFKGEMDSFYEILGARIREYKTRNKNITSDWDGILRKY